MTDATTGYQPRLFDYEALQPALAKTLQQSAERVRHLERQAIAAIGDEIGKAKDLLDRERFDEWLMSELNRMPEAMRTGAEWQAEIDRDQQRCAEGAADVAAILCRYNFTEDDAHQLCIAWDRCGGGNWVRDRLLAKGA